MNKVLVIVAILSAFASSCTKDKFGTPDPSCYPPEVSKILVTKCATQGCHNSQSAGNANGLDYSSWSSMFKGGKNGSSVIPYSPDLSYMLYFCNTDSNLGIVLEPTMPYLQQPLSREEYLTLRDWIVNGAPDCNGYVNFSDNLNRKKFYVCMQPCNKVAVFDAETKVIMRYISVGNGIGGPHQVRITPDGKYWCLVFFDGNILQVFRTSDDTEVARVPLDVPNGNPSNQWNTVSFTSDSKLAFVSNMEDQGFISVVDLTAFVESTVVGGLFNPHGTVVSKDDSILYVTSQTGNMLYKVHVKDDLNPWSVDAVTLGFIKAHEIILKPDGSQYYLSCEATNEVRAYHTSNDQLAASIPVGINPQEFSISENRKLLFVSCKEDSLSPGTSSAQKGSVYVIDYTTNTIVDHLHPGYQPHGIAVDDDQDIVYVANLNFSGGPAPHHISDCGGRNGYVTIIDMKTMELLKVSLPDGTQYTYKNEVLQFPYFVSYKR